MCTTRHFEVVSQLASNTSLLYSGKFSLVQNFVKMHPDSSEEIFVVFILQNECVTL